MFFILMAFYLFRGQPEIVYRPKTASTALANGDVVASSSGQLIKATTSTTNNIGVVLRDVVSTDSDYASTTMLPVMTPNDDCVFIADVTGGNTPTAALVDTQCDLGAAGTVATGTNTHHQLTIVGYISATKVLVKINSILLNALAS